ncbi:MAG: transketolase-like TK C-terminal-containing protein, partial [Gemmatimonadota bacterium]
DVAYRDEVLPPHVKRRISIEAGCTQGWREWTGDTGVSIGIDSFGASAPAGELFERFGLSVDTIVRRADAMLKEA